MFAFRGTAYWIGASVLALGTAAAQNSQTQAQCPKYTQQQSSRSEAGGAAGYSHPSRQAQNRANLSNEAVEMLIHTQQARQALASDNSQAALRQIGEALQNGRQLSSMASTQGQGRLVPIYTEYSQSSIIGPIEAAGIEQGGGVQAAGAPSQAPAVREVEGRYTNISVDVPAAVQHLQAARAALLNNDQDAADSALRAVQSGIILVRVESDLPLIKARQNLALAKGMIRHGNFQAARAPLREAVNALADYSGPRASQAEQLQIQIAQLMVSGAQQNQRMAVSQIDNWWNELADWTASGSAQRQQQIG